jgi:hypothetical protein
VQLGQLDSRGRVLENLRELGERNVQTEESLIEWTRATVLENLRELGERNVQMEESLMEVDHANVEQISWRSCRCSMQVEEKSSLVSTQKD